MILESEQKDQLYTALSLAQVEFPTIRVNRKAFKNEYADLYAMLKPVYPTLNKYGLSVHEWSGFINGIHCYGVRLSHKSGQYSTNAFPFTYDDPKPSDQKTHKIAGSQTYFFRYYVKGILGLLISDDPEDDDGQGHYVQNTPLPKGECVSSDQLEEINRILEGHTDICQQVLKGFNITSLMYIPKDKYFATVDRIRDLKYKKSELNIK